MANNNANDKKTMDVNKPGESTPDTSSRPVIVTHRPMVQDPMMVGKTEKKADEEPAAEPAKPVSRADKTIQPLAEPADDKPAENKEPVETEKPAEPETAEEKDEPDEPEQEDKPAEAEETATDELADKTDVSEKKKEKEETEAEKAKTEAMEKLVTDKTYFVPIGQVTRRRNNRRALAALVIIIVLALAGAYAVVDAGIIKTNISLPVHIFKK